MLTQLLEPILTPAGLLLSAFLVFFASWLWSASRSPGPWGLPVLGYYPLLRKDYYRQMHEFSQKYGEVYVINIAGQNFVHLDSMRAVREAHVNQADCFPARSLRHGMISATLKDGLAFIDGEEWRVQRKFFVQAMREIGIVPKKASHQGPIEDAVQEILEVFRNKQNKEIQVVPLLTKHCTRVIMRLVLGDDISEEEEDQLNDEYAKLLAPSLGSGILLLGETARWLVMPRIPGYYQMLESTEKMKALLAKIVERHKLSFSPDDPPRDLIDMYLKERHLKKKNRDSFAPYFTDLVLVCTLEQIYGDGSVSIALFISSFYFTISRYPDVQDSVYEEIVRVVGTERLPTWEDRLNLPLTFSVMLEQLRTSNFFLPVFPDMECIRDTTILGAKVPKGCVTLVNLWAISNNPEIYENPEKFDATRFLPGKKTEPVPTFGIGKRACVGETLVKTEMFMFIAATLQNFKILPEATSGGEQHELLAEDLVDKCLRFIPRPGSTFGC